MAAMPKTVEEARAAFDRLHIWTTTIFLDVRVAARHGISLGGRT